MQHLIIYTHPNDKDSFNYAVLQKLLAIDQQQQVKTIVRDLYQLEFNPILTITELNNSFQNIQPVDVKTEQTYIQQADLISFIYPLWWMGFPAILKGYIDRVFSYGFAYHTKGETSEGLLIGKKMQHFITMGSKLEEYQRLGNIKAFEQTLLSGLFNFCGIFDIKYQLYGNIHNLSLAERKKILAEIG